MASSVLCADLLDIVFPQLGPVEVGRVQRDGGVVHVTARTREGVPVSCPGCGVESVRVHSRYQRRVKDCAVGGQPVVVELTVRRLFCDQDSCPRRTFVEQVDGLTVRYGRYTPGLLAVLGAVGLALAGSAGARLARVLQVAISRVALISLVMALPEPVLVCPRVLGIDDFATRRGHHYGTCLVDLETHRVIDLLPGRTVEVVREWLRAHPGVEIICRDRSGAYAEAAREGAPDAVQVADRWHLWHNLGRAVDKTVIRLRRGWTPAPATPQERAAPLAEPAESRLVTRTRDRHTAVHALMDHGATITVITRELHLDYKTVRRYMQAHDAEDLLGLGPSGRYGVLDRHADYLVRRFTEGCHRADLLHRELQARGVLTSERTVRRFVQRLREGGSAPAKAAPTPRKVAGLLLTHPDEHTEQNRLQLKELRERCPELATTGDLVAGFAKVLVNRLGADEIDSWIVTAKDGGIAELVSFADGLTRDLAAVHAGVTLEWSSGQVEGQNNRIKLFKRQTYGRAGLPFLRKRVICG
ncbi:ISL3 family transposase [Streptomyces sp. H27-C3]|uniref:ISL3 family transposase n=1 Tax=Streptomyces sp. H27-C3 TaxID=3046305 RepID=UPI0024BAB7CE|nr:ISL3 family transposase [Streptomyces sp. H27-C3]MDJ0465976.1 ISL3 family transposase [Streptomyces sp. H27-C3]